MNRTKSEQPPKRPRKCGHCRGTGWVEYALDQMDPGAGLGREVCPECRGYGVTTP